MLFVCYEFLEPYRYRSGEREREKKEGWMDGWMDGWMEEIKEIRKG